jgi:hypothetical protein
VQEVVELCNEAIFLNKGHIKKLATRQDIEKGITALEAEFSFT